MIQERLLNAVLHLLALQTAVLPPAQRETARQQVLAYLNQHVGLHNVEAYIGLFDELTELHIGEDSNAVLEITARLAEPIKNLLHKFERYAVICHCLDLAALASSESENAPVQQIAFQLGSKLDLTLSSMKMILKFISDPIACAQESTRCRILGGTPHEAFRGQLAALYSADEELLLVAPVGDETIYLEGYVLVRGRGYLLGPGQVLRDRWGNEMHPAHIILSFSRPAELKPRIIFQGDHLEFRFPNTDSGLHDFSFKECDGRLIGIMGGSGAGKSTLLSILNGTLPPDSGVLSLNGRDVYAEPQAIEGVFGFIPQ